MKIEEYSLLSEEELKTRIARLKVGKGAVILAHSYQRQEVQDVADFIGDSLGLSQEARRTDSSIIVFCGVHFMAESAKILNVHKKVLLPDPAAGCPLADMVTPQMLRKLKRKHPGSAVVCYINSTAAVKAESDICCTSANAVKVVQSLGERDIIFIPDKNLGAYVSSVTGKPMILGNGFCYVHEQFTVRDVQRARKLHPDFTVVVHPECKPSVTALADAVTSTSGMVALAEEKDKLVFGTEEGLIQRLRKTYPLKQIEFLGKENLCATMKLTTLEKVLRSLEEEVHEIELEPSVIEGAGRALERMLEVS
ncbi:MAG: quinolinate synthase NadA [Candidatus Eisenbacteria bacterium]|nr:quinolinate synthase NadA [Candidatus Eisenbacteria bacterium]